MNISIIIFCHNEADNIEAVIDSVRQYLPRFSDAYEIIVVDDGSTDGTTGKIKKHTNIRCITHPVNKGIGMAIRSGYEAALNDYVCAIPGDGQFDVNELARVPAFDFNVFYSFYRRKTNYNLYRKLLTYTNRFLNKYLLGMQLKDVNWIKVYRKDQLAFVDFKMKSSIIESEICAKLIKAGCVPVEIPSIYLARKSGESKAGKWKTLSQTIFEIYALYEVVRDFKKHI